MVSRSLLSPVAAAHYPKSTGDFLAWFGSDVDCLDYLEWLRWPDGFVCPRCGKSGGWPIRDGRFCCAACEARTSVTAGTIFDRTRTPLTVWFHACWLFATSKDGVSAQSLQRTLEIGSYQTAWAMLHRLRAALLRPGMDLLSGRVQVDETYIGGDEPGLRGGRARGKKVLTAIAVEMHEPRGLGRCRIAPIADGSAASLHAFIIDHIEPGHDGGHRRLAGIPRPRPDRLCPRTTQSTGRTCSRGGSRRSATRSPPGRCSGQAVAAGHPPGLGRCRAPSQLHE